MTSVIFITASINQTDKNTDTAINRTPANTTNKQTTNANGVLRGKTAYHGETNSNCDGETNVYDI